MTSFVHVPAQCLQSQQHAHQCPTCWGPRDTRDKSFQPRICSRVGSIMLRGTSCEGSRGKQIRERRGAGLASSEVGSGSSLLQPQVCTQACHTASPPQDSRRPFLLLTQVLSTGVVPVPYLSRGLTSSGEHVLYVCRRPDQTRLEVGDPSASPLCVDSCTSSREGEASPFPSHRPGDTAHGPCLTAHRKKHPGSFVM